MAFSLFKPTRSEDAFSAKKLDYLGEKARLHLQNLHISFK